MQLQISPNGQQGNPGGRCGDGGDGGGGGPGTPSAYVAWVLGKAQGLGERLDQQPPFLDSTPA